MSYIQAILDKTAGMPLYIEKMVEFLDQQGAVGVGLGDNSESGFGTGYARNRTMLHNISLQQVSPN